jgi:5-(carboxyamino)imidazole ribonucleotide synthase
VSGRAVLYPPDTLGVLGNGQLGRMLALEARRHGYRVRMLSDRDDSPGGQLADDEFVADWSDLTAVAAFARVCKSITTEFENVPAAAAEVCASIAPLRPGLLALSTCQDRLAEKRFCRANGLPCADFAAVHDPESAAAARAALPGELVLKTITGGYDGKGQVFLPAEADLEAAWRGLGGGRCIAEARVPFVAELSVLVARGVDGNLVSWPVIHNQNRGAVLDTSQCPADFRPLLGDDLARRATREADAIAKACALALDYVGVLCVECFLLPNGAVYVNELAPRPHNSGHLTIEASETSQFAQQLRAACGLPLGVTRLRSPAAMANLFGEHLAGGDRPWERVLAVPGVQLHLYGKRRFSKGRKVGHLTALGEGALERVLQARRALEPESP